MRFANFEDGFLRRRELTIVIGGADDERLFLDRGRIVKAAGRDADVEFGLDLRNDLDGPKGIAADIVEIVGHPDGGTLQNFHPDDMDTPLEIVARSDGETGGIQLFRD